MKLNVLLAKTDHLASLFAKLITDYMKYFSDKSADFRGERKTYVAASGMLDEPGKRGNKLVVTTVSEKLEWLEEISAEYIDALFAQEATNASGKAVAELVIDGKSWGKLTSLELLRLKSLIENGSLEQMYSAIPTRRDDEEWTETEQEMYKGRQVFESAKTENAEKTTVVENYVLEDPNIGKSPSYNPAPQLGKKNTIIIVGDSSHQKFSGEWSAREKAELLRRRSLLLVAVIEALKVANEADAVQSSITAKKIFTYLHEGK
jgi:hypothetical protein